MRAFFLDWKMESPPGMTDYYLIETADLEGSKGIGGGLGKQERRAQPKITSSVWG